MIARSPATSPAATPHGMATQPASPWTIAGAHATTTADPGNCRLFIARLSDGTAVSATGAVVGERLIAPVHRA
jgi:hypothetical protein